MVSKPTAAPAIGSRLRALRRERGLSLDATAACTGTSKAMLGQIERSESSPTIATLWKIATGLEVPLSHFLAAPDDAAPEVSIPRPSADWHEDIAGMRAQTLFPFDAVLGFEMFEVAFLPGARSDSPPHAKGSIEQIRVTEGELVIEFGGRVHRLRAGESLRFAADQTHGYRNTTAETARALDVIHYLRRNDRPR